MFQNKLKITKEMIIIIKRIVNKMFKFLMFKKIKLKKKKKKKNMSQRKIKILKNMNYDKIPIIKSNMYRKMLKTKIIKLKKVNNKYSQNRISQINNNNNGFLKLFRIFQKIDLEKMIRQSEKSIEILKIKKNTEDIIDINLVLSINSYCI